MEINSNDIVRFKKLSCCKTCKNDTFIVTQTGTDFKFKCNCCNYQKTLSSKKIKTCIKEVISTLPNNTRLDF